MKTIEPTKAPVDEVLAEVRRRKREIAKEHGFDVRALARSLQRRQEGIERLVSPPSTTANKRMETDR